MLLHISALPFFFVAIWTAVITPKPEETPALSIRDNLCSEVPTLNMSEVCSTTSESSSASTLKSASKNYCDHALYLVQNLCDLTKSDKNLIKTIEANVTTLLSTNNDTNVGKVCTLIFQKGEELGYVIKSATEVRDTEVVVCNAECVNIDKIPVSVKPLCNFILWSWTFIRNHSIGNEASKKMPSSIMPSNNMTSAPNGVVENKTVTSQVVEKPDISQVVSQNQQGIPPANEKPSLPQTSQDVGNAQTPQSTGPTGKADVPLDENVNEKEADPVNEDSDSGKLGKNADQPPTPVNRPSNPVDGPKEDSIDRAMPQGLDVASKTLTHAKNDEEELLGREDGNEDSHDNPDIEEPAVNNVETLSHEKLQSDDRKDIQGVAKNSKNDFDLEDRDNGEEEDPDDEYKPLPKRKNDPVVLTHDRLSAVDEDNEAEDSHFFGLFFVATFVCIVFYLIYQNKRKIIAMALEGKKGRHSGRRRPTTASYQKLDNKLDEVMASSPPPSKTHVIY